MGFPTYTIATETANGVVDLPALMTEIEDDATAIVPDGLTVSDDGLTLLAEYADAPTQAQKDALDSVIDAHDGVDMRPDAVRALLTAVCAEVDITSTSWTTLGGVRVDPDAFVNDIANVKINAVGEADSQGNIHVRLVKGADGSESVISDDVTLPDTFGDFEGFSFLSNVTLVGGTETYKIQGKRQGAGDGKVRYALMCFVEAP